MLRSSIRSLTHPIVRSSFRQLATDAKKARPKRYGQALYEEKVSKGYKRFLVLFYFTSPIVAGYFVMKYSMNFAQSKYQSGMEDLIEKAEREAEAREALNEVSGRRERTNRITEFRQAVTGTQATTASGDDLHRQ